MTFKAMYEYWYDQWRKMSEVVLMLKDAVKEANEEVYKLRKETESDKDSRIEYLEKQVETMENCNRTLSQEIVQLKNRLKSIRQAAR